MTAYMSTVMVTVVELVNHEAKKPDGTLNILFELEHNKRAKQCQDITELIVGHCTSLSVVHNTMHPGSNMWCI